jgi:hypothetical protein
MNQLLVLFLIKYVFLEEEITSEDRDLIAQIMTGSTENVLGRIAFWGFLVEEEEDVFTPIVYTDTIENPDIVMGFDDYSRQTYLEQFNMLKAQIDATIKDGTEVHKMVDINGVLQRPMTGNDFMALVLRYWAAYKTLWDARASVE